MEIIIVVIIFVIIGIILSRLATLIGLIIFNFSKIFNYILRFFKKEK